MPRIEIRQADFALMVEEARRQTPNEACGLIAGIDGDDVRSIRRVYILENEDHSPEHFSIAPVRQLEAIREMRVSGLVPLGNWHSHPATPARPSAEDIRLALDGKATYLILSLAEEEPVLRAFHIENGESRREELRIIEGE